MNKKIFLICGFLGLNLSVFSQGVGINESGSSPDASAILDVSSTEKGFLPPRMTTAQRDAMANPAQGLMIFNTTTERINYFSSGIWYELIGTFQGVISSLECSSAAHFGSLGDGQLASGVSSEIPYSGGNGGAHNGQLVSSTGVLGLTATLSAGSFNNGVGNLTYTITGTPTGYGIASFALNIGGQNCTLTRTVVQTSIPNGCNPSNPTAIVEVLNPSTGRTWMDRNIGANRAAISSADVESYGFLYQWGRGSDGHQCVNRYSGDGVTTSGTTSTLSSSDTPGHGNFILSNNSPFDWRNPQNNSLWDGVNGINNPCPSGFRLPTSVEWNTEIGSWSASNSTGAFASPLKLSAAGRRIRTDGTFFDIGTIGYYWASTISGANAIHLFFSGSGAQTAALARAPGFAVRCIKN